MKQKDLALILVIVIISGVFSLIISKQIFSTEQDRSVQVKTVEAISTEFVKPDEKYFNEQSINPTQTITIGPEQSTAQDSQTQEQQ